MRGEELWLIEKRCDLLDSLRITWHDRPRRPAEHRGVESEVKGLCHWPRIAGRRNHSAGFKFLHPGKWHYEEHVGTAPLSGYQVRVFGSTSVYKDGSEINLTSNMRKMLCLIVAAGTAGLSIDRALTEAADGDGSARAHSRVRMDISRLRKRIGPEILPSATGVWRLEVQEENVDYFDLQTLLGQPLPNAARLAEILRGRPFPDAPPGTLISEAIQNVTSTRLDLLRRMSRQPESINVATLQAARRLIDDDPLNEDLVTTVIEHHLATDHQQGAREILANTTISFHELLGAKLPDSLMTLNSALVVRDPTFPARESRTGLLTRESRRQSSDEKVRLRRLLHGSTRIQLHLSLSPELPDRARRR